MPDPSADTLDALVVRAQDGDREAFHALALAAEPAVRLVVASHAPHPHLVDELVHATLVRAYERLASYRPRATFLPWIKAIARNEVRMELRARGRGHRCERVDAVVVDAQLDALERAEDADLREAELGRLRDCLARLPAPLRRLVEAHHVEGLPVESLASAAGRSANWVAVKLFRLRRTLAACVGGDRGHAR